MRKAYYVFALLAIGAQAATVSNITFVSVEHSSAQIRFEVSGAYTDYRIRYIASPGTCTDGSSGFVNDDTDTSRSTPKRVNISGLTSGGVYQVCPEVFDGSWSSGVGETLTLATAPAVLPDPPVAPAEFSTAMPDVSGCTVRTASTCGDIQTEFTAAKNAQGAGCSLVKIPLGPCDISTALIAPSTAEGSPHWVVVMPNVDLDELPPEGVRITPEWASKMATLNLPSTRQWLAFGGTYYYALEIGLGSATPKKWRFIGIRFTHDDTATSEIANYPTPDPHGFYGWLYMDQTAEDIIFDRCGFEGHGYPNRIIRPIVAFEGTRSAIIDSYFSDLDWWHSYSTATYSRTNGTTVEIGAGTYHNGDDTHDIPATTIVLTGGSDSGRGASYLDMVGNKHLVVPGDITATCSGSCSVHQVPLTSISSAVKGATTTLTVTAHAMTDSARVMIAGSSWSGMNGVHRIARVIDENTLEIAYYSLGESGTTPGGTVQFLLPGNAHPTSPRIAALPIGYFTITSGSVTDAWQPESIDASTLTYEGTAMFISQKGPGPIKLANNSISSAGLTVHFDDGCPSCETGDFTVERNHFVTPTNTMFWHAESDGARYFSRHQLEIKNGRRVRVKGNRFNQCIGGDGTPVAACFAITATAGSTISDIDVESNTFTGAGATMLPSATNVSTVLSPPAVRSRFENNLMVLDAVTYSNPAGVTRGWAFYGGITAAADSAIRRNTVYSLVGDDPAFIEVAGTKYTGYAATDNFFVAHSPGGIRALGVNQCGGLDDGGKDVWECAFPGGVFSGNVVLATYTETTLCARYGGTWADGNCAGGLLAKLLPVDGIANAGFYAAGTDFRRTATSPLLSGAGLSYSGRGVGADVDELRQAQGEIYNVRALSITSSGATIYATVPDSGASCYVGYGTGTDPTAWTWTAADTTASRVRGIALTGLSSATQYHYRLVCAGTYQPATQTFTTATP